MKNVIVMDDEQSPKEKEQGFSEDDGVFRCFGQDSEEENEKIDEKKMKNFENHQEKPAEMSTLLVRNHEDHEGQLSTLFVRNCENPEEEHKNVEKEHIAKKLVKETEGNQNKGNKEDFSKKKQEEALPVSTNFSLSHAKNQDSFKKNPPEFTQKTIESERYAHNNLLERDQGQNSHSFSQASNNNSDYYRSNRNSLNHLSSEIHEQKQSCKLIFTAFSKEKYSILINSSQALQEFLESQPFPPHLQQLSLTFSFESSISSNATQLSRKLFALFQEITSLNSLELSFESPQFHEFPVDFPTLFSESSAKLSLTSLKLRIKCNNSLKLSSEELSALFSQSQLLCIKLNIAAKFPLLLKLSSEIALPRVETLVLSGCVLNLGEFSMKIPRIKRFSSVIPAETHCQAVFIDFLEKNAQKLAKLELFLEEGGPSAKLVENVKKLRNLERISLVFLNNSKNNAFSEDYLYDLLEKLLFSEGELEQLIEISLEIREFLINEGEVLKLLQGKELNIHARKLKKLSLNSTDFFEHCMNPEFLEAKAEEVFSKELTENLRNLLRSKTILKFIEKELNSLSFLSKTLEISEEAQLLQQLQELIATYDQIFSDLERDFQRNQQFFSLSFSQKAEIWFLVRALDLFFELDPKMSFLCINFRDKSQVKNSKNLEEESPFNGFKEECRFILEIDLQNSEKLDFSAILNQMRFSNLEKLLLLFENNLEIPAIFLELIDKRSLFSSLRVLAVSIHINSEKESAISAEKSLIFPKKLANFKLVSLFLHVKLPKIICEQSLFSDFCEVLSQLSQQKSLENLEFSSITLGNEDFYPYFLAFMQGVAKNHASLRTFSLNLRNFSFANGKLHRNTLTTALEHLKTLRTLREINVVLREASLGSEFLGFIIEFLLNCKQELNSLSLDLRNNKLVDSELELLWRSLRNFVNLKQLRLYLHQNGLNFKTFALLCEEIKTFPEKLAYLKLDFEKNPLNKSEGLVQVQREEILVKLLKNLSIRLKNLKDLQFHVNRCKLGKRDLLSFLKEVSNLQIIKLFCDLSGNTEFWEARDWSPQDFKEIEEIFMSFQAKDAKISLKPLKKFRVDASLQEVLKRFCEKLKEAKKNTMKLIV